MGCQRSSFEIPNSDNVVKATSQEDCVTTGFYVTKAKILKVLAVIERTKKPKEKKAA